MTVSARVVCQETNVDGDILEAKFSAATFSDPSDPNASYCTDGNPLCMIRMAVNNPNELATFVPGNAYDISFTPVA